MVQKHTLSGLAIAFAFFVGSAAARADATVLAERSDGKVKVAPAVLTSEGAESAPITEVQYRRTYRGGYGGYGGYGYRSYNYGYPRSYGYYPRGYGYYPRSYGYYPSYGYAYARPYYGGYYGGYYPRYYSGYRSGFSYAGRGFYGSFSW